MTEPTQLSLDAQAVLDAANMASSYGPDDVLNDARWIAAAVLLAAADQVVPDLAGGGDFGPDCCITTCEQVRADFLAIAAELEGAR